MELLLDRSVVPSPTRWTLDLPGAPVLADFFRPFGSRWIAIGCRSRPGFWVVDVREGRLVVHHDELSVFSFAFDGADTFAIATLQGGFVGQVGGPLRREVVGETRRVAWFDGQFRFLGPSDPGEMSVGPGGILLAHRREVRRWTPEGFVPAFESPLLLSGVAWAGAEVVTWGFDVSDHTPAVSVHGRWTRAVRPFATVMVVGARIVVLSGVVGRGAGAIEVLDLADGSLLASADVPFEPGRAAVGDGHLVCPGRDGWVRIIRIEPFDAGGERFGPWPAPVGMAAVVDGQIVAMVPNQVVAWSRDAAYLGEPEPNVRWAAMVGGRVVAVTADGTRDLVPGEGWPERNPALDTLGGHLTVDRQRHRLVELTSNRVTGRHVPSGKLVFRVSNRQPMDRRDDLVAAGFGRVIAGSVGSRLLGAAGGSLDPGNRKVFCVAVVASDRAWTVDTGAVVRVWDLATRQVVGMARLDDDWKCVMPTDGRVCVAYPDRVEVRRIEGPVVDLLPLEGTVWAACGDLLAVGDQVRRIRVLTVQSGQELGTAEFPEPIAAIDLDGTTVLVRGQRGAMRVWRVPAS